MEQVGIETGVVKYFNSAKGFGFITRDGQENDIFYHITQVQGQPIKMSDRVEFEIGNGKDNRPMAVNVKKID